MTTRDNFVKVILQILDETESEKKVKMFRYLTMLYMMFYELDND